ncbi:hypothetical protein [Actinomycetospora straminea]|uniref:AI-2E family transporter n=1 Tax=Actinomycetospora straminea TaxID=663607 RepID=A0ABP9EL84_9PSEU|nr:hypothetical protein [Actinomycetospora straminea]MDD7933887.1 hypothetical protein [Actinomycetospora straminea]
MSAPTRETDHDHPRPRAERVRVRARGLVALAALLVFYVVGGVHRFAPDLGAILPGL